MLLSWSKLFKYKMRHKWCKIAFHRKIYGVWCGKKQVAYFWQEESKIAWWFVIKFLLLLGTNCVPLCGEMWWWWWGGIIVWWNGLNGCAAVAVCGGNGVEVCGWSQWSLMVGQVKHDGRWRRLSVVVLSGV